MQLLLDLAERGLFPDTLVRRGIRRVLAARLAEQAALPPGAMEAWVASMGQSPIALEPAAANQQHYEVPPAFFEQVLGRNLKYSCGLWADGTADLDQAEEAMLALTVERAQLADGQAILELGCGWGSLTLWMARHFPRSRILAVSNSAPQRAFILARAAREGLSNVTVQTADMNTFDPGARFDRVVSVEMFEHMRNWAALLGRVRGWLQNDGRLFLHVFAHQKYSYPYEDAGSDDWMARHFFSGGMMPAHDLLDRLDIPLQMEGRWWVSGTHYARTSEAWLRRLDANTEAITALFQADLGWGEARRNVQRWRIFFLACAELFAWENGEHWGVSHQLLRP